MTNSRTPSDAKIVAPLVTAAELAEAWKCHPTTVARLLRRAGYEPITFTDSRNGLKRWRLADVQRFLRERSQA